MTTTLTPTTLTALTYWIQLLCVYSKGQSSINNRCFLPNYLPPLSHMALVPYQPKATPHSARGINSEIPLWDKPAAEESAFTHWPPLYHIYIIKMSYWLYCLLKQKAQTVDEQKRPFDTILLTNYVQYIRAGLTSITINNWTFSPQ